MLEEYCKNVSETVKTKYGFTVPWELIIEMILQFLDGCMKNREDFVSAAKNPTILQRIAMNLYVRKVCDISNRRRVVAVADSVFEVGGSLTEEQLVGAYQEGQLVLGNQ